MSWNELKANYIKGHLAKPLMSPKTRLNAFDRIEKLIIAHFPDIIIKPEMLRNIPKSVFKGKLAKYKESGVLNGSEESVINGIYRLLD